VSHEWISAGYYVTKNFPVDGAHPVGAFTLASDHQRRHYFPETVLFEWTHPLPEERAEHRALFGYDPSRSREISDQHSSLPDFLPWSTYATLALARESIQKYLPAHDVGRVLIGVALHRQFVAAFLKAHAPPASPPGYAPIAPGGVYATIQQNRAHAPGGRTLGFEVLMYEEGDVFNSPNSLHFDVNLVEDEIRSSTNELGLISDHDSALRCLAQARTLFATQNSIPPRTCTWFPWLISKYDERD